jgi:hypothetical protein
MKRKIPGLLWISIVALILYALLTLVAVNKSERPLLLIVSAVSNVIILIGLVLGHKWAYILTILISVVGIGVVFRKSFSSGVITLILNGLVIIPMILCTQYFFPNKNSG